MKSNSVIILMLVVSYITNGAFGQGVTTPQASPKASVNQEIGIANVQVKYSRPSVKGRIIWGDLVPFGYNVSNFGNQKPSPWRAGANENTTIRFSHDATICGEKISAGEYGLFIVLQDEHNAELILSKDNRSWGAFFYEKENDVLHAKIKIEDHAMTEILTYEFINVTASAADLVLNWEKKQFPIHIDMDMDKIVMENIKEELKGPIGFNWLGYSSAANYALQNPVNYDQGLTWINTAVNQNRNFNTLIAKANVLRKMNKTDDADNTKMQALNIGTEAEINIYGYTLANQNKMDEAVYVLTYNTEKYKESANAFDSLGEIYALKGDSKNAIKNFKKSLGMNPSEATKANSIKYLKKLGEMK